MKFNLISLLASAAVGLDMSLAQSFSPPSTLSLTSSMTITDGAAASSPTAITAILPTSNITSLINAIVGGNVSLAGGAGNGTANATDLTPIGGVVTTVTSVDSGSANTTVPSTGSPAAITSTANTAGTLSSTTPATTSAFGQNNQGGGTGAKPSGSDGSSVRAQGADSAWAAAAMGLMAILVVGWNSVW